MKPRQRLCHSPAEDHSEQSVPGSTTDATPAANSLLSAHLAVAFFGIAGVFGKLLPLPPVEIVFYRTSVASIFLIIAYRFSGLSPRNIVPSAVFLLPGALLALHWVLFFDSIQRSSVAVALLMYSTFPVFVCCFEPLLLGSRANAREFKSSLLALLGVALIVPSADVSNPVVAGSITGLLSGLSFALLVLINKDLRKKHEAATLTFWQITAAALLLAPFMLPISGSWLSLRELLLVLLLGVFCTAGAHLLFIRSLQHLRAGTASVIATLEPVYGALVAILILNEIPGFRTVVGGTLILFAAVQVSYTPNKSKSATDTKIVPSE